MQTMHSDRPKPYYWAYDQRYRDVYAQGLDLWSVFPDELATMERVIGEHLGHADTVLETGCGEGAMARLIAPLASWYVGIDLSSAALDKARSRAPGACFIQADITQPLPVRPQTFDLVLDVACLHMLVVDVDRANYLRNLRQALRSGGRALFINEATGSTPQSEPVLNIEHWQSLTGDDYDTPEPREAWRNGQRTTVHLRRLPARGCTPDEYRAATAAAGFGQFEIIGESGPTSLTFSVTAA
jgi:SAM-dependent methyltransferase